MSVEKHYSSLKPHFTLTILPPALFYPFQLFGHCLLNMVKVERCTCPVKHCFLKFKITDRFFVLLKSTGSLKRNKRAITRMHWLCGQVSRNILGFFLKTVTFFFHEQIFSVFQTLHLVGTWKLLTASDHIQLLPSPRHVYGISRCVHTLARLDVCICSIKVVLSVVKGWVMLVIDQ